MTVSTMVFTPTIKDAGKFIGCRAADKLTGEGSLEDGWKLSVTCKENIVQESLTKYNWRNTLLENFKGLDDL